MKCSFCEAETSELVKGPANHAICITCINLGEKERCSFCNQVIGTKKGIFKKKTLQVARMASGLILCNECLQIAESVV